MFRQVYTFICLVRPCQTVYVVTVQLRARLTTRGASGNGPYVVVKAPVAPVPVLSVSGSVPPELPAAAVGATREAGETEPEEVCAHRVLPFRLMPRVFVLRIYVCLFFVRVKHDVNQFTRCNTPSGR